MTPSIFEKSACDLENCSLDYEISSRRDKRDTDAEKFEDNNVCSVCERSAFGSGLIRIRGL